jgi:LuxR family maltose regulon positive regulatory protein
MGWVFFLDVTGSDGERVYIMAVSLLSTKFHIPHTRANGVSRPRLTEKLFTAVKHSGSFVLLSSPAGFGKTTLLSEFLTQFQHPAAWVSLDEADNDPINFWTYLIIACQTIQREIGESALELLQTPQSLPDGVIPTLLINDLVKLKNDFVLVLDDYHEIHNPSIHADVSFLLDHLPDKLHFVISTRVDPPWPLARFRARDQLIEIRSADLRFTTEEAAAFLNQVMGLSLSSENVSALEARTEGWIASLQLAAISMKDRGDIDGFIKTFTGSHVYIAEYLIEEVLNYQTDEVKTFLLQTSILERLNDGLCTAVSGLPDRPVVLKDLYQANLFVVPLDEEGQWFRYHHLFADLLQARLRHSIPPDAIAVLHQRAAVWYERSDMAPEAIDHALAAKDYSYAVRLIGKVALPMVLQGYVRTVDGWLRSIPQEYPEHSPQLMMAFAWLYLLRGDFAGAAPYLERLTAIFSTPEMGDQDPSLLGEWLSLQSKLLCVQGKPAESCTLANRALQLLPAADTHMRNMVYINLATAYEQLLDYDRAAETFQMIARDARETGNFAFEILGISGQAQMLLQQGQLHLGFEVASQGVHRVEERGRSTPFSATLYGELGQIHYQWHQLDQARSYLQRSIQASGLSGYSDPEIYNHVMLSRMCQMEGNWDASAQEMGKASDLARVIPPAMIRENVISQQVRVDLAFDRLAAAQMILKAEGFTFNSIFSYPDLAPGANVTHPVGLLYNSALRVLLFLARTKNDLVNLERGIELATLVLAGELQCRQIPVALETLLLRSQMLTALGNERDSLADVDKALELAEPEGFISIFAEEGMPISESLTDLIKRNLLGTIRPVYVQEILSAFPGMQPVHAVYGEPPAPNSLAGMDVVKVDDSLAPIEPLTPRELEVLQLIAAGDSNQTIADKLFITLSAVKKHTGNIFKKLNVNSRTQAVVRARLLGLISLTG